MKTILLIRHAKSDQGFPGNDFERPLNERGKRDAPDMAGRLKDRKIRIDKFVSSPAVRAFTTARIFSKAYDYKENDILQVSALYHAPSPVFYDVIAQLSDQWDHVAIFSHNPGITNFVNSCTDEVQVDNMPTCGIFAVEADCEQWSGFEQAGKRFLFFDYPKKPL